MNGPLVSGVFALSAMIVGLAALHALFTEVWPADPEEPWYVFTARTVVGGVAFVAVAAIPAVVVVVASPSQLAILALLTAPVAAVAHRYITRV